MSSGPDEGPGGDPFAAGGGEDPFADGVLDGPGAATAGRAGTGAESVEDLLRQAAELVATARRAPLSSSVLVPREELLEVIQRALDCLPDELRQARWLLRERQEFMEQRQREADALLDQVRAQAERMVQRTEIARQADLMAKRLVAEAREEARRLRHETEDFCDQRLAKFEIVLDRTMRTVRAGRERLASAQEPRDAGGAGPAADRAEPASVQAVAGTAAGVDGAYAPFDQDSP